MGSQTQQEKNKGRGTSWERTVNFFLKKKLEDKRLGWEEQDEEGSTYINERWRNQFGSITILKTRLRH